MGAGDSILPPRSWNLHSQGVWALAAPHDKDILVPLPEDTFLTPRFHVYLNGTDATRLRITTKQGSFDLSLADIAPAGEKVYLDGRAKVQDSAFPMLVGRGDTGGPTERLTDNDFSSISAFSDGSTWVAWQGFDGKGDRVYAERLAAGQLASVKTRPHAVSPKGGDVYRTAVAEDAEGKAWVVWAERIQDNFDLYARSFDGESWSRITRLTRASQPDTQHKLVRDSKGRLHLVWQGFRGNTAGIFHKWFTAQDGWSEETRVSADGAANCWEPSVAVDSKDNLFVGFDCYGPNGYDVFVRGLVNDAWGAVKPVAATARFEAYVTLAADADDRIWMAWHESGVNWGKDYGYPFDITANGTGLYASREIRMAVLEGDRLQAPSARLADSFPPPDPANNFYEYPQLAADGDGRIGASSAIAVPRNTTSTCAPRRTMRCGRSTPATSTARAGRR
ncbi:MAG: hypothetical protein R2724_02640 [Bryobacterales bacterium]